ncbi:probable ATP-dependent RNA helicase DDX56 [Pollicipes pollicipes]|uniref:probable ATP-dependent RNA helicase DDX56 n=1 Tax=Pollicipes pollicipes TaxID=41117 RepID=UPI001884AB05|nr:probable ATP-dependent RNA helicase DDX56 [Pollicipes pollicipes]XP_037091514.1 probable ATP-dependent RNA helicase DDX56 [Pollicipes pollicipes]
METEESSTVQFHEMGLDDRLLLAIARLKWEAPTLIQEKTIPLALEGKDILARARTGSGKSGAFAIPVIQTILQNKKACSHQAVQALVLAPTRELCQQLCSHFESLTSCCSREVRCVNVGTQADLSAQRSMLMYKPDIVVGTPSRVLAHIQAGNLDVSRDLKLLVVDEADLMLTFGHNGDLMEMARHLPPICQVLLMSATLSDEVKELRQLLLHNPVILKLEEPQLPAGNQLSQYHLKVEENDKFVLIYTLFKLKLVRGKTIIFVGSVDRCYKLKLYFEQFGIPACALSSELPANSRSHILSQFNDGAYDIIIASDERFLDEPEPSSSAAAKPEADETGNKKKKKGKAPTEPEADEPNKKKRKQDKESGVARGIDFQFVSNVINFDFPLDVDSYIHRVGRTARGNSKGSALSFVSIKDQPVLDEVTSKLSAMFPNESHLFKPYLFKMEEIEGFRYRAQDAMRAVTKRSIREARLKEIKQEMLNSRRLQSYFEENPRDLQVLRHDKALHTVKVQRHMKHVPEYIVPKSLRKRAGIEEKRKTHKAGDANSFGTRRFQGPHKKKQDNPLKTLKFDGFADDFR